MWRRILRKALDFPVQILEFCPVSRPSAKGRCVSRIWPEQLGGIKVALSPGTRMQVRKLIERHDGGNRIVLIKMTKLGENSLAAARPVHAESVRRNLLSRLTSEQTATMVRISNILGED